MNIEEVASHGMAFADLSGGHSAADCIDNQACLGGLRMPAFFGESKIRRLVDAGIIGIYVIDLGGDIIEANDAFLRMVGCERADLTSGMRWTDLTPPEWHAADATRVERLKQTGRLQPFEKEYFRKDGTRVPVLIGIARFEETENQAVVFAIDLTDRRRADEALRRSDAFLAQAQHLSQTGSFFWRVENDDIQFSAELYRLFEFEHGSPLTIDRITDRIHSEDVSLWREKIQRARNDQGGFICEIRLQMPDGRVKYCTALARSYGVQGGALEYCGAIQDITKHRLSELALSKLRSDLAHVARVASLGVLTASIAHEVSQPLSGITTNMDACLLMLSGNPPNINGAREAASRTIRDAKRAAQVVTRLRALFSKKEPAFEPVDLNEATREVITLSLPAMQANRIVLRTDLGADIPAVQGDRIQLQQVILNLIQNAIDAMATVDGRPRYLLMKTERFEQDWVRLSTHDSGIGIDPDVMERLFDSFYTMKTDGMGIGLAVSRAIIESHNGRLWVEHNKGAGATFSFAIPRQRGDCVRSSGTPDA